MVLNIGEMMNPKLDLDEMLAGMQRWIAIESPTDSPEGMARMASQVQSAYESFGMSRKGFISARGMWEMFVGGKTAFPRMKQGMEYPAFLELVKNEMKLADSVAVSANSFQREGKLGSSTLGVDECSISFDIFKNWLLSTD